MILLRVELRHVGPFRDAVTIGPFSPGLNLLCAPNEAGKSTALRAAARALFDRHTTKADEVKALQPAGTELAPRVVVDFATAAGRFRIDKTFLLSPRSLLQEETGGAWQTVAEGDRADARVQELLHGSLPGRGATKAEHWGFLGFLWSRQGEAADWPTLADEGAGRQIRHRLARVELDPVMDRVAARLAEESARSLTAIGHAKAGGPLAQAEEELRAIDAELARLNDLAAQAESLQQRHRAAEAEVLRLEQEHAALEEKAAALLEQTRAAERLLAESEGLAADLENRRARLAAAAGDARLLDERQAARAAAVEAGARAREGERQAGAALEAARATLAARRDEHARAAAELDALRAEAQRLRARLDLREARARAAALDRQAGRAALAAAEAARLRGRLAALPSLTPAALTRLESLATEAQTLQAQVQALGLTVELEPERESAVDIAGPGGARAETARPGAPLTLRGPQHLDLTLRGWGRVSVRSGSREAGDLHREHGVRQAALAKAFLDAGVTGLEAAREAVAARRQLDTEAKAAAAALAAALGDVESEQALEAARLAAARRVEALASAVGQEAGDLTATDLEARREAAEGARRAAEAAVKALAGEIDALHTREREAMESSAAARREAESLHARQAALEAQIADLHARHPGGLAAARDLAEREFVEAEARIRVARARLPPDHGKLPERRRRAAAALQEVAGALLARRAERDAARGSLEALGAQGLYSRATELAERRAEVETRRDAARARAWAARLGQTLIEHRRQESTRSVLAPLEETLSAAFAELTGHANRRVFLDADLGIAGIGPRRESAHAFAGLSQGAREQLLLCLRVAVARELSRGERQTLWLDDALVNTDAFRQERVLDLLSGLAGEAQVVLLTCHPERHRGAGHPLALAPVPT